MTLALGVVRPDGRLRIEAADNSQRVELHLEDLAQKGLPKKRSRVGFVGELRDWGTADFRAYCQGLNVELPIWADARHQVFTQVLGDGTTVLVPALAFMRAFFWPCDEVLPAAFTNMNIDRFAYVGYCRDVPVAMVLAGRDYFRSLKPDDGNDRHLKWLHSSRSARSCAQSVELAARQGWLSLRLPMGEFDVAIVGQRTGNVLYATSIEVNSVSVPATDNISGQDELFYLHRSPPSEAERRAAKAGSDLSVGEWQALEPLLRSEGFTGGMPDLALMLRRLANGYWDMAQPGVVLSAGRLLREWVTTPTLSRIMDKLDVIRRGIFPLDQERLAALKAVSSTTVVSSSSSGKTVRVFLDTEFVDRNKEAIFLSIGLDSAAGQFYGERPPGSLGARFTAGQFIDEEVLPQLGTGIGVQGTMCEIGKALATWLNGLDADHVEVHYDFNIDYTLLEHLLSLVPGELRVHFEPVHIGYLLDDSDGSTAAFLAWSMTSATKGLGRHHALADAIALRARFEAVHGKD